MIVIRHTQDTRSVYDDIYTGEKIRQMDSYFIWICRLLGVKPGESLLDIATGRGQMIQHAGNFKLEATGLDFSFVACQHTNKLVPGSCTQGDAMLLPFADDAFDYITNLGSLEHFEDMAMGVREMARVLKPSGLCYISVPNTFGLRWNVQYAWRHGDVDDDGQPLQRYGTRRQWETLLTANGLQIVRVLGYEHERAFPRTWHDFVGYLRKPKRMLSMLIGVRLIPVNMAGQFVFLCKPEE